MADPWCPTVWLLLAGLLARLSLGLNSVEVFEVEEQQQFQFNLLISSSIYTLSIYILE